jgi:response regulator of citrate/malate metabolism
MLKQAFGDDSLVQTLTYGWHKRFKNGRTSTDDDDRSGRPSNGITPETVVKVKDLILQDRSQTIQELCNTLGLSYGTCQRILSEELNMRKIVPRLLEIEQKQQRLKSAGNFNSSFKSR